MAREIRCQGAIIRNREILLIKSLNHKTGNTFWWLPGGGIEEGETQEECIIREIKEETNLDVEVRKLMFEISAETLGLEQYTYKTYATYWCTPLADAVHPGEENSTQRTILEVAWYPLDDETSWEEGFYDEHLYPFLKKIQSIVCI